MDERVLATLTVCLLFCGLCAGETAGVFDYGEYGVVLGSYVDDDGMVNYKGLKSDRQILDKFIDELGGIDRGRYEKWSDRQKIAFWLNAYNALTLKAIIDHYPIKSSWLKSRIYPKNSIRQIDGVWTKLKFNVMGEGVTLEHIEHGILRKEFGEPRIHMAMVCAAIGCPSLRNEPYTGEKLADQLDDQSLKFLLDPSKFRIRDERAYLSPIFKWFGEDFVESFGQNAEFKYCKNPKRAVLGFVKKYAVEPFSYTSEVICAIKYLDYDWSLNEQAGKKGVVQ